MTFDVINVPYLGQGFNTTSFVSVDIMLDAQDDIVLMPDGTIGNVSGVLKLAQDIELFLLSPQGTSFIDANWGNPAINMIGTAPSGNGIIEAAIQGGLQNLKRYKDSEEITRGYPLEGSELINSINSVVLTQDPSRPNVFIAVISVTDKTGIANTFQITLR